MRCPECGVENKEGRSFCVACGSRLVKEASFLFVSGDRTAQGRSVESSLTTRGPQVFSFLASPVFYVLAYVPFMVATYVLPYFGSNSLLMRAGERLVGFGPTLPFWLHLAALLALVALAWLRGSALGRRWLVVFPVLAALFDFVPPLVYIPLVPTAMHLFALVLGVALSPQPRAKGRGAKSLPGSDGEQERCSEQQFPEPAAAEIGAGKGIGKFPQRKALAFAGGAAVFGIAAVIGGYWLYKASSALPGPGKEDAAKVMLPGKDTDHVGAGSRAAHQTPESRALVPPPPAAAMPRPPAMIGPEDPTPPAKAQQKPTPQAARPTGEKKVAPPGTPGPSKAFVDETLEEGRRCLGRKKYDCAIAAASAVLRVDPSNATALALKEKAQAEQQKALDAIAIQ